LFYHLIWVHDKDERTRLVLTQLVYDDNIHRAMIENSIWTKYSPCRAGDIYGTAQEEVILLFDRW
jgi:hypothetical protein